jgi:dihydrofolate synthase / folylpolyglutamate synthase
LKTSDVPSPSPDPSQWQTTSLLAPYFSRTRGEIMPGVHRMRLLLEKCGLSSLTNKPRLIVGGTNGKGSTCALLESALRSCGFKTGLYTSPHLIHPGERVRISGVPSEDAELAPVIEKSHHAAQSVLRDASFFEILTCAAILSFENVNTDIDIYEVGLGGRFDSTNVISPTVSVLTSVGRDHVEILGDDEASIAHDKSHIGRRNRPLIYGDISERAQLGLDVSLKKTGAIGISVARVPLPEKWQKIRDLTESHSHKSSLFTAGWRNGLTVLQALNQLELQTGLSLNENAVSRGLATGFWPGRFDLRHVQGQSVLFDAAHNSHGARYFAECYKSSNFSQQKAVFLFGSLSDKDWPSVLEILRPFTKGFCFVEPTSPRAVPAEELFALAETIPSFASGVSLCFDKNLGDGMARALKKAQQTSSPVVVVGSIALLGEVMEKWGVQPFEVS